MAIPIEEGWFKRPLATRICLSFPAVHVLRSHSSLLSKSIAKENESYISFAGFEPTTFLIHDLENLMIAL